MIVCNGTTTLEFNIWQLSPTFDYRLKQIVCHYTIS